MYYAILLVTPIRLASDYANLYVLRALQTVPLPVMKGDDARSAT